jgi:hypothetical protein
LHVLHLTFHLLLCVLHPPLYLRSPLLYLLFHPLLPLLHLLFHLLLYLLFYPLLYLLFHSARCRAEYRGESGRGEGGESPPYASPSLGSNCCLEPPLVANALNARRSTIRGGGPPGAFGKPV